MASHDGIDALYADLFMGEPMEPGETWPRFDVMLRNGQEMTGVPGLYLRAARIFDMGDPDRAARIDELLSTLCDRYDRDAQVAAVRAALAREAAAAP